MTDKHHNSSSADSPIFERGLITRQHSADSNADLQGDNSFYNRTRRRRSSLHGSSRNRLGKSSHQVGFSSTDTARSSGAYLRHGPDDEVTFNQKLQQTQHAFDPPRPAKRDMEWVWFPQGYWAERPVIHTAIYPTSVAQRSNLRNPFSRKSRKTSTLSIAESTKTLELSNVKSRRSTSVSHKPRKSDAEQALAKLKVGLTYIDPTYPHFMSPHGIPEGLYCKTRRNVGKRFSLKRKPSVDSTSTVRGGTALTKKLQSKTTITLQEATTLLERSQRETEGQSLGTLRPKNSATSFMFPRSKRTRFGLAPWHRKKSFESFFSVSSSMYKLLSGRTPSTTPNVAENYTAANGQLYPKVEISDTSTKEPNFLPSEATRIITPAISPKATPALEPTSFFFGVTCPDDDKSATPSNDHSITTATNAEPRTPIPSFPQRLTPAKEWFETLRSAGASETKTYDEKAAQKELARNTARSSFSLSTPEHLPSSPLCPKHPLFVGKGNGVCVYHGRKRLFNAGNYGAALTVPAVPQ